MNSSYSRAVTALDSLSETTETFKETTLRVANINATLNDNLVSFDQNIQKLKQSLWWYVKRYASKFLIYF